MKNAITELSTYDGIRYLRQEGQYIYINQDSDCKYPDALKISIPLFYEIALYTSVKRSYKNVPRQFLGELQKENIKGIFESRVKLENATQACGIPGGRTAYLLGMFCRY